MQAINSKLVSTHCGSCSCRLVSSCRTARRARQQPAHQLEGLLQLRQHSSTAHQGCQSGHRTQKRACAVCVQAAAPAQEQPLASAAVEAASAPIGSDAGSPSHASTTSLAGLQHEQLEQDSNSSNSNNSISGVDDSSSSSSVADGDAAPDVTIKVLSEAGELEAVAQLRAEAYYANDRSRFAASFKKQFAAQEVASLRQRTAPTTNSQRPQLCDCLVAVDAAGAVVGCIDIRLPESVTGMKTIGVPDDDSGGCYLLNVVVSEAQRGCGIGKALMRSAMERAVAHWGAQCLYTHVEADNEAANRLYRGCGFYEHSSEAKYANASSLGRLVLLMVRAGKFQQGA